MYFFLNQWRYKLNLHIFIFTHKLKFDELMVAQWQTKSKTFLWQKSAIWGSLSGTLTTFRSVCTTGQYGGKTHAFSNRRLVTLEYFFDIHSTFTSWYSWHLSSPSLCVLKNKHTLFPPPSTSVCLLENLFGHDVLNSHLLQRHEGGREGWKGEGSTEWGQDGVGGGGGGG